jgi:hypothetical protein
MNRFHDGWIATARERAETAGLRWNPSFCPHTGKIDRAQRWNLTKVVGLNPPPTKWLSWFSHVDADAEALDQILDGQGQKFQVLSVMSPEWCEFTQAAIVHELLIKRNKISQAEAVYRAIRVLALCAGPTSPAQITAADVQLAYNVALRTGSSGKLALNVRMVVRGLFDNEHLADRAPLGQYAQPYSDAISRAGQQAAEAQKRRESSNYNVHHRRSRLADRKSRERLPEMKAFWELIRIVFTETPRTFTDRIRFAVLRLQIANGLRLGENSLIPVNWFRWREYFDTSGRPASESGGISRSLHLRYYGLKQDDDGAGSGVRLVERFQEVPVDYENLVRETMEEVLECTAPLRKRLQHQTETGRLLPEYSTDDLVSAVEMFRHVGGSIRITNEPISDFAIERYRSSHSTEVLREVRASQDQASLRLPTRPVYKYWHGQSDGPIARDSSGSPLNRRGDYSGAFFRVGEVEEFIRRQLPTKLPDTGSFTGPDGLPIYTYQFAFLHPSRALIEGRDGGLVDIERYFSVGRLADSDLQLQLSDSTAGLFARYGKTDEDRTLSMNSHSGRHLQNGELFRLGVADTMITKRYGRSTTSQSKIYDHRSLAEDLEAIDLPASAREIIPERAHDTLRLIMGGKVQGPIVTEFLSIQTDLGDQAAFEYLAAEADGLHVTPYGFCLNSFTVDPCPKHLQCFNGCRHLARTENPAEKENLLTLKQRTGGVLAAAKASPAGSVGRKNQIANAESILSNVEIALAAAPGQRVFPQGPDLSEPIGKPRTIMDSPFNRGGA